MLKEEAARSLEEYVALDGRHTLELSSEVVSRAGTERRSCTGIGRVCLKEGLKVCCGGAKVVRCDKGVGFVGRTKFLIIRICHKRKSIKRTLCSRLGGRTECLHRRRHLNMKKGQSKEGGRP